MPRGVWPPRTASGELRYERQCLLGEGGMGVVHVARDRRLRRQVAPKVAARPEHAARLATEAWITAQREHPGVVAVYDAGETDGLAWYTMRLIRGRTLQERVVGCADLGEPLALLQGHSGLVSSVEFSPEGDWLASASWDGTVRRWDLSALHTPAAELLEGVQARWGLSLQEALRSR